MEVSLTSGTNWATSNVPGLDPDSQSASQVIAMGKVIVAPGETITALPKPETMRESNKGTFLGAYAYKKTGERTGFWNGEVPWVGPTEFTIYELAYDSVIDLNDLTFTEGGTVYDQAFEWTAPDDGEYMVVGLWTHGNYKVSSPGAETCYATNYFDIRGVEALQEFWNAHYLDDPELNAKILEGDVQLFMDSIELSPDGGITWWTEDIRQESSTARATIRCPTYCSWRACRRSTPTSTPIWTRRRATMSSATTPISATSSSTTGWMC